MRTQCQLGELITDELNELNERDELNIGEFRASLHRMRRIEKIVDYVNDAGGLILLAVIVLCMLVAIMAPLVA